MHFPLIALKRLINTVEYDAPRCELTFSILLITLSLILLFQIVHISYIRL